MLGTSLDIARSALKATAEQAATVSRNIANASSPLASVKRANATTAAGGGVAISSITRAMNDAMTRSLLKVTAEATGRQALSAALERLGATILDPELGASPAAGIAKLRDALQVYAASPEKSLLASSAVTAAKDLAGSLNEASTLVQTVRREADQELSRSMERINVLLADIESLNKEIVKATIAGVDQTDSLDGRDALLRSLSEELGIKVIARANNEVAIYTDSGLTLLDGTRRPVAMATAGALGPGISGNAVFVDNVAITGPDALLATHSGRIQGLAVVRDTVAVVYQNQLDEIARGLIAVFAETDQSAVPALPDIPGLFTHPGAPAMPPAGTLAAGLALTISVNPNVDPAVGGSAVLLRDGSIGDPGNPAYTYNASGAAGYSERLHVLIDALTTPIAFDPASTLGSPSDVMSAAATSTGWIEEVRKQASEESQYHATLQQRAEDALSREIGVNLDEELASMLEIERSYQITSKLVSMLDEMLATLVAMA